MPKSEPSGSPTESSATPQALFGEIVRRRRGELGVTQVDLQLGSVDDVEISQSHISNLERGLKQPCLRTMLHLERVLELPPGELFRRVRLAVEAANQLNQ